NHLNPRLNKELVVRADLINCLAWIGGAVFGGILLLFKRRFFNSFFDRVSNVYPVSRKTYLISVYKISIFLVEVAIYRRILTFLKTKHLIVVSRSVFSSLIVAANALDIKTYELQHGITTGPTALYTGDYDEVVDVDFFLTFGAYWIKPVFGIPIERMYDLGWAFSEYVKDIMPVRNEKDDRILLVSSPSITDNIL